MSTTKPDETGTAVMSEDEKLQGRIRNRIRESLELLLSPGDFAQSSAINWWCDWVYPDTDQEQEFAPEVWAALMAVDRQLMVICEEKGDVPYTDPRWLALEPLIQSRPHRSSALAPGCDSRPSRGARGLSALPPWHRKDEVHQRLSRQGARLTLHGTKRQHGRSDPRVGIGLKAADVPRRNATSPRSRQMSCSGRRCQGNR